MTRKEDRAEKERRHSRDPDANPEDRSRDSEPHHALSNPASDPDPTEWPDPYEDRPDPRDPAAVDTPADPAEDERGGEKKPSGANPRAPSTSEPHPPDHDDVKPLKGDG